MWRGARSFIGVMSSRTPHRLLPQPSPRVPNTGEQQWEAQPPAPSPGSIGWSGKGSRKPPARSVATAPGCPCVTNPRGRGAPSPSPKCLGRATCAIFPVTCPSSCVPRTAVGWDVPHSRPPSGLQSVLRADLGGPGVPRGTPLSPLTARLRSSPSPNLGGRRCSSCPPRCSPPRGTPGPGARWGRAGGAGLPPGAAAPGICPPP